MADPSPDSDLSSLLGFTTEADADSDEHRGGSGTPRSRRRRLIWFGSGFVVAAVIAGVVLTVVGRGDSPPALRAPEHVAGLTLDNSSNATNTAEYLRSALAAGMNLTTSIGAVYTDGADSAQADAHSVIFVGGTTTGNDAQLVDKLMSYMDDNTDGVTSKQSESTGGSGSMTCGKATDSAPQDTGTDTEMAICAYADKGQVGIALFPNRDVNQAAILMRSFKSAMS